MAKEKVGCLVPMKGYCLALKMENRLGLVNQMKETELEKMLDLQLECLTALKMA